MFRKFLELIKRYYKRALVMLGVGGLLDIAKEILRSKLEDWALSRLGWLGPWLFLNPFSLLTIALILVLLGFVVLEIKESFSRPNSSVILDYRAQPMSRERGLKWTRRFSAVVLVVCALVGYGFREYYVGTHAHSPNNATDHTSNGEPSQAVTPSPQLTPPQNQTTPTATSDKTSTKRKSPNEKPPASVNPNAPVLVLRPPTEPPSTNLYEGNQGAVPNDPHGTYFRNNITSSGNGQNQITLRGNANFIANVVQGMNIDAADQALLYDNFFAGTPQGVSADEWKNRLDKTHAMLEKRWEGLPAERQKDKENHWDDFAAQVQMQTITQGQMETELRELLDVSDPKQPSQ